MSLENSVLLQTILVATIPLSVIGFFVQRIVRNKSIGIRTIQFMTVLLLIPSILLLAITKIISSEILGTLFGAIIGYVLSTLHVDRETQSND